MPPLILVSNDDGIHSPGLRAVVEAVHVLGDVLIAAPSQQQSGQGGSLFGDRKARFHPMEYVVEDKTIPAYHCDCTPALVIQHALAVLCLDKAPDLVIAGCNYGENLGANVTASGTVGGAFRAAIKGIPSLAVSLETDHQYHFEYGDIDWRVAAHFTHYFAEVTLSQKLPLDVDVLKIDIPKTASLTTPWKVASLSKMPHFDYVLTAPTPTSTLEEVEFRPLHNNSHLEPGTDLHTFLVERLVTVPPLSLDFTSRIDQDTLYRHLSIPGEREKGNHL